MRPGAHLTAAVLAAWIVTGVVAGTGQRDASPMPAIVEAYLDRYFRTFPSRATEVGRHDLDSVLEDLGAGTRRDWVTFNRDTRQRLVTALASGDLDDDDRLDAEVLLAQVDREIHEHVTLRRPERDALYWTTLLANAHVFLLVRDDLPMRDRLARVQQRARLVPRLARQAREALRAAEPAQVPAEWCRLASGQARATAVFYREGLPAAADAASDDLRRDAAQAAASLESLASFLDAMTNASGSVRLGSDYAATFRLGTGVSDPVPAVRDRARRALAEKLQETATFGRRVWADVLPGESAPNDDRLLVKRLFARVAEDRDASIDAYVERWRVQVAEAERFVRDRGLVTLPDPLTLRIDRSPSYFLGQSVGGVYAAGPYAPEAATLLFLPLPPDTATPAQVTAFFRDFNRRFNRMIVPHEIIPGHYLQLKFAARHPRKVRAIFPDPVYVEGWGTFCERLLLDEGWGGPLERLAHLKKQLENIARTIVDIEVHTGGWTRDEVLRFVREEALQEEQFAGNMWTRAITTSPQLTTYFLGYEEVFGLYAEERRRQGASFSLRRFMDGLMALGPVPVRHYRK